MALCKGVHSSKLVLKDVATGSPEVTKSSSQRSSYSAHACEAVVRSYTFGMTSHGKEPASNTYSLADRTWRSFSIVHKAFFDTSMMLPFTPLDTDYAPTFLHSITNPDRYLIAEKPYDAALPGRVFKAVVANELVTLDVSTAVADVSWREGKVDKTQGMELMRFQAEIGLSIATNDEVQYFNSLLHNLIVDLAGA